MNEGGIARIVRHPLSPFKKRTFISIVILAIVMAIGTVGMMVLESWDPVTSFYFMSILATAEGLAQAPVTVGGKIFASVTAFFSIGAAISEGFAYVEKEEDKLKTRLDHKDQTHSYSD
ncbi:hypothetical protein E6H37_06285 [Candidatus Bathyarchaeota archaeon]|nr:MAG: hypothetical protein E6H37_06285 [Candidatus Bathyarchaeota archaeon]